MSRKKKTDEELDITCLNKHPKHVCEEDETLWCGPVCLRCSYQDVIDGPDGNMIFEVVVPYMHKRQQDNGTWKNWFVCPDCYGEGLRDLMSPSEALHFASMKLSVEDNRVREIGNDALGFFRARYEDSFFEYKETNSWDKFSTLSSFLDPNQPHEAFPYGRVHERTGNIQCDVPDCESFTVERHHYFPKKIAAMEINESDLEDYVAALELADQWFIGPLCRGKDDHHGFWHKYVGERTSESHPAPEFTVARGILDGAECHHWYCKSTFTGPLHYFPISVAETFCETYEEAVAYSEGWPVEPTCCDCFDFYHARIGSKYIKEDGR